MDKFTQLIINTREFYIRKHYKNSNITFREINRSSSDLFAYNVIQKSNKYKKGTFGFIQIYSVDNIINNTIMQGMLDGINISFEELSNIDFIKSYTWLYYSGKYYDIETPEGVDNLFDLPLLNIPLHRYIENRDYIKYLECKPGDIKRPFIIINN
jgi:hypothetical protein